MNISFGQKIPMYHCSVQNTKTKEFVPATVYEYDCCDFFDAENIDKLPGEWIFKPEIFFWAKDKYLFPKLFSEVKIFSLETSNNETIGLMQFSNQENYCNVGLLENMEKSGHKYVGTALLNAVANETLKNGYETLKVAQPVPEALDFYVDSCGFKQTKAKEVSMTKKDMLDFLKRTKEKTNSQLVDLKG